MTLTTDRMTEIMVAATVDKSTKVRGTEEKKFLAEFLVDLAEAKEEDWIIQIPPEWEVDI